MLPGRARSCARELAPAASLNTFAGFFIYESSFQHRISCRISKQMNMQKTKFSPTTKDVALLHQLQQNGQLKLQPEFQRNSVWPKAAKAYLIDTILNEKPIPLFFFQRTTSPQTGRHEYAVIDGQQRLRAIFEFLEDRFSLTESKDDSVAKPFERKKYSQLTGEMKQRILNYDLVVQELSGYSDNDIRDMFARMNRYVVPLSKQELRHAKQHGKFKDFVEKLGAWPFWTQSRVFTKKQSRRMRPTEFCAELAILLCEGPQDKKRAVDLYYVRFQEHFRDGSSIRNRLQEYLEWINKALPDLPKHRFRRSSELYSLIGAIDRISKSGSRLPKMNAVVAGQKLIQFEGKTKSKDIRGDAARYVLAASKHTDDLGPRVMRTDILESVLT